MRESWQKIEGFSDYQVSNKGRIRSRKKGKWKVIKHQAHWKGYRFIHIYRDKQRFKFFMHRLVAMAFIPNPDNMPIVNHKDLDKAHNHVPNLEWVNESGNMLHWRKMVEEMEDVEF